MRTFRLFLSSPVDAATERRRAETIVSRLNGEFAGLARLETVRWETEFYQAHETFQTQIPAAASCDLVVGILRWRLGTPLPAAFPDHLPDGEAYPSGTAYEILTAIEKRRAGGELPEVFVFRYAGGAPHIVLGEPSEETKRREWAALGGFFARWFLTPEGQFKAAFNSYKTEDDFESQLETLLRKWLAEKVAGGRAVLWPATKGSPFRGLSVFGAKHAPVFFGRNGDIRRTMDLLRDAAARNTRALILIGASGSGKSSLARAGLVPRLVTPGVVPEVDLWRVAVLRPSDSPDGPFVALAAALLQRAADLPADEEGRGAALPEIAEGDWATPADLAALLAHADAGAVKPVVNALSRVGDRARAAERYDRTVRCDLVLLVDQLDELFATSVADDVRTRFGALLQAFVATGRVWLVTTLRVDLYASMLLVRGLKALKDGGASYDLVPPGVAELAETVRAPAAAAALTFETDSATGERLDERLLREADRPDMLPLVQLALSRLWDARETNGDETCLTFAAFDRLGGVKGIVEEAGETALIELGDTERDRLAPLIRRLVVVSHATSGAHAALTVRAIPRADAAPDAPAKSLVDALITARLLTLVGEGGDTSVRLAHQRVLTDWSRVAKIVASSADFYRVRDEVEAQRVRWESGNRRGELLLARGLPLAEGRAMAATYASELTPETKAFIAASRRRANRAQATGWGAAAVFAVVAVFAVAAAKVASDQRAQAVRNFATATTAVDGLVFNIAQGLEDVSGMRLAAIRKILETARAAQDQLLATAPKDRKLLRIQAAMLNKFATTYRTAGDLRDALKTATEGVATCRRLVAKEPGNVVDRRSLSVVLETLGNIELQAGDQAAARAAYDESLAIRRKLSADTPDDIQAKADVARALIKLGDVKMRSADLEGARSAYRASLDITRILVARDPADAQWQLELAVGLIDLGEANQRAGDLGGALAAYKESLAAARRLVALDPTSILGQREVALGLDEIGDVLRQSGDLAGAMAAFQEALDIGRQLLSLDTGSALAKRDVATRLGEIAGVKQLQGDRAGALTDYSQSLDILRKIAAQSPDDAQARRDVSVTLDKVGDIRQQSGDSVGALAAYQESLAIRRRLAAQETGNVDADRDVAVALDAIGDLKRQIGAVADAIAAYDESLAIQRKIAAADRRDAAARRALSVTLNKVGDLKRQTGDVAGALAAYEEDLAIARALAAADPGDAGAQRDLTISFDRIGDAKLTAGDTKGALAIFRESLDIRRRLAARDAGNASAQRDLAISLDKIGNASLKAGYAAAALVAFQEALTISRALAARDPGDLPVQRGLSIAIERIGALKTKSGDRTGALAAYAEEFAINRKLAALDPASDEARRDLAISLNELGGVKLDAGDTAGALAAFVEELGITRALAAKNPGDPKLRRGLSARLQRLGILRKMTGDYAGALAAYEEDLGLPRSFAAADAAIQPRRDLAAELETVGELKLRTQDLAGARVAFNEYVDIVRALAAHDPSDAEGQWNLAVALAGTAASAADPPAHYREALAICEALDQAGKLIPARKAAIEMLRKRLADKPPT